jgi:hypothetical protein
MPNITLRRITFVMAWGLFGVGVLVPGLGLGAKIGVGVAATACFVAAVWS